MLYSAAIRGGLIEAIEGLGGYVNAAKYSAAIRGGLIEAPRPGTDEGVRVPYSAAIRGGLIEAGKVDTCEWIDVDVFRRDSRRPHGSLEIELGAGFGAGVFRRDSRRPHGSGLKDSIINFSFLVFRRDSRRPHGSEQYGLPFKGFLTRYSAAIRGGLIEAAIRKIQRAAVGCIPPRFAAASLKLRYGRRGSR